MITKNEKGFTLIEILIATALTGLVMTGVYRVYSQQIAVNNTQTIVRDMQQNIRAAMYYMEREVRMAGLDPSGNARAGVENALIGEVTVSADTGGGTPGDPNDFADGAIAANERVTYRLLPDADNDGICDNLQGGSTVPCHLRRVVGDPTGQGIVVAQNIDVLDFIYLGVDTTVAACENDCVINSPVTDDQLDDIRSIQITIVARAGGASLPAFLVQANQNREYRGQNGQIVLPDALANDGYRRNLLTNEISLRNMGL